MDKQTAIEWLIDKLSNIKAKDVNSTLEVFLICQQAKALEKEQIIDAHGDEQSKLQDDGTWRVQTGEQYYNETYGKTA